MAILPTIIRLSALLLLMLTVTALLFFQQDFFALLRTHFQNLGAGGAAVVFVLLFACGTVLLIPSSLFMILGGACFGLYWGFLLNMAGYGLGSLLAFLVSRYMVKDYVAQHLPQKIGAALNQVDQDSWRMVAALRLAGLVPAVILNYALGLTPIRIAVYTWASVTFTLPVGLIFTYAGTAGEEFINSGDLRRALLALSLVALVAITWHIVRKWMANKGVLKLPGTGPSQTP